MIHFWVLERTKKHLTKKTTVFCLSEQGHVLQLPKSIARNLTQYEVQDSKLIGKIKRKITKTLYTEPEELFSGINAKYGKANALVKAIRLRAGMS